MEAAIERGKVHLKFPYDYIVHTKVKAIPGGKFDKRKKSWEFPASPLVCNHLEETLGLRVKDLAAHGRY